MKRFNGFTTDGVFLALTGVRFRTGAAVQFDARIGWIRWLQRLQLAANLFRIELHCLRTLGLEMVGTVAHMTALSFGAPQRTVACHMRGGPLATVEAAHGAPAVNSARQ